VFADYRKASSDFRSRKWISVQCRIPDVRVSRWTRNFLPFMELRVHNNSP